MIMMYGNWGGWSWMMILWPLLWIALTVLIVWAMLKVSQRPPGQASEQPRRETPQEILDRRFASGEIDPEAYTQARPPSPAMRRVYHDPGCDGG
jgi:putative membrane protein